MPCNITIDGVQLDTIGIKIKGNSSFNSYPGNKKSFKLTFDEYQDTLKYDGLKVLNLNNGFKDPTLLREKIMLDFLHDLGLPAPRCTYAKVYINGTYWGLYNLVEQVNKTFLNDMIGNKDGNLFKGDPSGSLQWGGASPSAYYPKYELKTNDSLNDWTDLVHFIDKINNTPSAQFHDSLETVINTAGYMQQWAANNLFVNLDSYVGSGHNYYIYHNSSSNKFDWITWDVNEAFGNFNQGMSGTQLQTLSYSYIPNPANSRPLNSKMLADSIYKYQYINYLCSFINYDFTEEKLFPKMDSLANKIRTDYYADTQKMYTNQQFEDNIEHDITVTGGPGGSTIPGLKSFLTARRTSMFTQLASFGCTDSVSAIHETQAKQVQTFVFPDPFISSATIFLPEISPSDHFIDMEVFDITGKSIRSYLIIENPVLLERGSFSSGFYFYMLRSEKGIQSAGKFCVLD